VGGRNAPGDVLVGIGNAKMSTLNLSRKMAQDRAREVIQRRINNIGKSMTIDFSAGAESTGDTLTYQQTFNMQLSRADTSGARIVIEDRDADGEVWCVMYLSRSDVEQIVNTAESQARLSAPNAAAINAMELMNKAFAQEYQDQTVNP
jgi:hypothetical protein